MKINKIKKIKEKKAVSLMVSYVLLVVIAVSLGLAVYAWLKLYVPTDKPECPEGVSVIIKDISCSGGVATVIFQNKGTFDVEGVIIKTSSESEGEITYMPEPNPSNLYPTDKPGYFYFGFGGLTAGGGEKNINFPYTSEHSIERIQIQSFVQEQKELALCGHNIIVRDVGDICG